MEAILLAGGLGTRLYGVTGDLYPKSLAHVDGVPFIHYVIRYLESMGVKRFIFAVSHLSQLIIDDVTASFPELDIDFSIEDEPMGTGGAIKQALRLVKGNKALIVNSDSFMEFSLDKFIQFSNDNNANLSIICTKVDDVHRFGAAEIDERNVLVEFSEKGQVGSGYINSGIYLITKAHPRFDMLKGKFSFEKDVISDKEEPVFAMKNSGLFFDIGNPDDLHGAQALVTNYKKIFAK